MDYTIKIGGEAGQGIQTIGDSLGRVFARAGYHVFIHQDYESRIRGGHNFFQVRVSDKPVTCSRDAVDIVIALDRPSIEESEKRLTGSGMIVYDPAILKEHYEGPRFLDVPFVELATKDGGSRIMANTVATGAVLGMLGMRLDIFLGVIGGVHGRRRDPRPSRRTGRRQRRGYDFAVEHCDRMRLSDGAARSSPHADRRQRGVGLGAVLSGCTFYSGYPMTPSTGILHFMADKSEEYGIVVEQAEDEIAAVNMAIGASFAGARSMTATAGGGFALMVEGVSLAAMTETPLVVAVGQRPAPATGLPTRTEQGDLLFVLHAGHGEFPRVIFAPGSPGAGALPHQQGLRPGGEIPDTRLRPHRPVPRRFTVDLRGVRSRRRSSTGTTACGARPWKRRRVTRGMPSPLPASLPWRCPGRSRHLVVEDSDEHDEEGHLTEDARHKDEDGAEEAARQAPLDPGGDSAAGALRRRPAGDRCRRAGAARTAS